MKSLKHPLFALSLLFIVLSTAHCDSVKEEDSDFLVETGKFQASIEGSVQQFLQGDAYYDTGKDPVSGAAVLRVLLVDRTDQTGNLILLKGDTGSLPEPGYHRLDAANRFTACYVDQQGDQLYEALSGSLSVLEQKGVFSAYIQFGSRVYESDKAVAVWGALSAKRVDDVEKIAPFNWQPTR